MTIDRWDDRTNSGLGQGGTLLLGKEVAPASSPTHALLLHTGHKFPVPHLAHVLLIKPEEMGISGIHGGGEEQGSTKQRADQVSQGQVSGMPMFSSFNVLINDLGIKISLMLMRCSTDAML